MVFLLKRYHHRCVRGKAHAFEEYGDGESRFLLFQEIRGATLLGRTFSVELVVG